MRMVEERFGPWIVKGRTIIYLDPQAADVIEYDAAETWQSIAFVAALLCFMVIVLAIEMLW